MDERDPRHTPKRGDKLVTADNCPVEVLGVRGDGAKPAIPRGAEVYARLGTDDPEEWTINEWREAFATARIVTRAP